MSKPKQHTFLSKFLADILYSITDRFARQYLMTNEELESVLDKFLDEMNSEHFDIVHYLGVVD